MQFSKAFLILAAVAAPVIAAPTAAAENGVFAPMEARDVGVLGLVSLLSNS